MKGISSIFSSLIVTLITLSLAVPLFLYFNSLYNTNSNAIGQRFNQLNEALSTEISVIKLGNKPSQIYIYNYGYTEVHITLLIINNVSYNVNVILKPNEIIPLISLTSKIPNVPLGNSTIIIEANGNYYYIS